MKIKDLIRLLQQCDPEDIAVVPGYEGGYDDVNGIRSIHLKLNQNSEWYYGVHDSATEYNADCTAILIYA